jgi:two-component system LytT family sensor kinase
MNKYFQKIEDGFPLRTLLKISWFSATTFTVLIFLMTWLEQNDLKSALITRLIDFVLLLVINLICVLIIYQLFKRNIRGMRLAAWSILLVTVSGSLAVMLDDHLVNFLAANGVIRQQNRPELDHAKFVFYAFLKSGLLAYLIVTWQVFVLSQNERMKVNLENAALKAANSQAVNQLLLQQIHPHFLFNALTTIKSLIYAQPDMAAGYIVRLSNFLRTSMTSIYSSSALLEKEIVFCTDYLELQQVRHGKALIYRIDIPERLYMKSFLPVFTLQSLAENAIKHNYFSESEPLHIVISEDLGVITVKNDYRPNNENNNSLKSGLLNLSERYKTLSGNSLQIHHDKSFFYISFKLISGENYNHRG